MAIGFIDFQPKPPSGFTLKVDWSNLSEPTEGFTDINELVFAGAKDRVEKQLAKEMCATLDYMRDHAHDLATNPHDMIMNGDLGAWTTGLLPNHIIRLDIPDAFLHHPRALPIELKGIAV